MKNECSALNTNMRDRLPFRLARRFTSRMGLLAWSGFYWLALTCFDGNELKMREHPK